MKKFLLLITLLSIIFLFGCGKKIDYTGYYNYVGEDNGYSEYCVGIHITKDKNGIYTIAIKDGDFATDCILYDNRYDGYGDKYRGSFTYDGDFRQGKTFSFVVGPSEFHYTGEIPYNSDIMVDLRFKGNKLFYKNSKSLNITDKKAFKNSNFIECDKVVAD